MKQRKRMFVCCCVMSLALCFCGCGKESSPAGEVDPVGDPVEISLASDGLIITGVEDLGGTRAADAENRVTFVESLNDEYDLEVTIAPSAEETSVPTRAAVPVNGTMRIVACDAGGNIVSQCAYDVTDGVATEQGGQKFTVPYSTTPYTFHCFTPGNALDLSTKKAVINETDNFNYANTQITINSTTGTQSITTPLMQPMMSKLKYAASSDDVPGEFTCKGTIKGTFGSSATWTLGSSNLTTTGTAGKTISFNANNEEKLILSGVSTGTLSMTISDLVIGGTSYGSPTLTSVDGITLLPGKIYTVTVKINKKGIIVTFRNASGAEKKVTFASGNLYYNKSTDTWGIGAEQCDYGYVENGVTPGTQDMKLVDGTISYYFMYGMLQSCGRATTGYYTGTGDVPAANDPCSKLPGGKWRTPKADVLAMLGSGRGNDYCPVDENGVRLNASSGNPYWGSYTPTDGRINKSAIPGMWIGLSQSAASTAGSTSTYNKSKLFLPVAGYRYANGTYVSNVGSYGDYWGSQPYNSNYGQSFRFSSADFYSANDPHSAGFSVRCSLP